MTQEHKDLLLKDLCARLPYGINCEYQGKVHGIVGFNHGKVTIYEHFQSEPKFPFIEEVKLYLFPLSSMTEEQIDEWGKVWTEDLIKAAKIKTPESIKFIMSSHSKSINWCYKNHFDVNDLILKGSAIDATNLNVY